jgi:hypothetical protein
MGLKDLLLIEKLGSGIVFVTVALVLFLGVFIYGSVMSSNPYAIVREPANGNRAPASVINLAPAVESAVKAATQKEAEVISLDCFNGSTPVALASKAKQIRLRGPVCGNRELTNVEVINRTNGYVGTIFRTEKLKYSSDYIHLAAGANQILLSFTDSSGEQHVSELTISRGQ